MSSNEERIARWRSRRQDKSYTVGSGGDARRESARTMDLAALSDVRSSPAVTLKQLIARLQSEPNDTVAARRDVYNGVQAELEKEAERSGLPETLADFCWRRLRGIVRLLEQDIRAGVDVFESGYMPATLVEEDERLTVAHERRARRRKLDEERDARRHASRNDIPLQFDLPQEEATDLAILRGRMHALHERQRPRYAHEGGARWRALLSMFVYQLHVMHGESRVALLWALVGPVVLLSLISSLYFLMGTHYILGMDVPTFAMTGATTWIMFRQIIFRSSAGYVSARALLNLEGVTPLMCALVQAFLYVSVYLVVFAALIAIGHSIGLISLPDNRVGFVLYVVLMGVCGAAMGLLFGAIATAWHFFLRLAAVIERTIEIFSGVFFVSEQLPEQLRPWLLWSPFAHGMQLLRSVYFDNYESQDASVGYFLVAVVFLVMIALAAERLARSDIQPM
jgi:ABC-type polysaccharide/polyol phosphate export permease